MLLSPDFCNVDNSNVWGLAFGVWGCGKLMLFYPLLNNDI
jgi:hypothetical protein